MPFEPNDLLPERGMDPGAILLGLIGSPNLASRRFVFEQYDSTVQVNTVVGPGHGAAVLRVKGTSKALVATTDGNQAVGAIDPWLGAALSVAEATRNVSITGARPLGVTNCLNYGDPTRPEAFWQLKEGVRGLADACRALGIPVTGGNVSLYNESPCRSDRADARDRGVVGLLDDVARLVGPEFRRGRRAIILVGETTPGLAGSAYAELAGVAPEDGPPGLDLAREAADPALRARGDRAWSRGLGPGRVRRRPGRRPGRKRDLGGSRSTGPAARQRHAGRRPLRREPVAAGPDLPACYAAALGLLARQHGLPVETVGSVGGDRLTIELGMAGATGNVEDRGGGVADALEVPVADLRHAWDHGLARALGWEG